MESNTTEILKKCRVCNLELKTSEFEKNRRKCKKCMCKMRYELNKKKNYYNNYYDKNKEVVLKSQKEYYLRKKERLKAAAEIAAITNISDITQTEN